MEYVQAPLGIGRGCADADLSWRRALLNTGGALSYIARWENWYAAGNFGQERL